MLHIIILLLSTTKRSNFIEISAIIKKKYGSKSCKLK